MSGLDIADWKFVDSWSVSSGPLAIPMVTWCSTMAIDIRRCSKEDLDRLNVDARAWRDRNQPGQDQEPDPVQSEAIPVEQLDLEL
jgi:hypothetical protein